MPDPWRSCEIQTCSCYCFRWKLHLRPRGLASSRVRDNDIPPLPRNKSAVEVLADFMAYLYRCARTYIQDTHANGQELWSSIESHIDFVLTHPNGWEGAQQSMIRRAAVLAELVSDMDSGQSRIQLVTEGEASLHFCIGNGLAVDGLAVCVNVIVSQLDSELLKWTGDHRMTKA